MKIPDALHSTPRPSLPLLPIQRSRGRRPVWPSERLERLLTPREVDDLLRGRFLR
ncbi:hypothetical protein ACFYVR_19525 [Rhodococcus sp. NPDC003318]|uniref:hypothetical protein n=1 Tax=Rhodococcus sp. NPDC003318 TaxID=3364503 RepID=UPI0036CA063D